MRSGIATETGNPAQPPANQIENPNPQPRTNNYYSQDGYSGGSYSACADPAQPGVTSVVSYLRSLPMKINPNCDPGHYYLLNNYNPGYFGNGTADTTHPFTIPPSPVRSIGDVLLESQVSFRWYGEGWTQYVGDPSSSSNVYCNICNPFQYQTSIMTDASVRDEVIRDTTQFYTDLQDGILPAVSFVKPGALNDGHPASSKWNLFEAFTRKILVELQKRPDSVGDHRRSHHHGRGRRLLRFQATSSRSTSSATVPRIPLIVVSPVSTGGRVVHSYNDHVSILKFIEANWG